LFHTKAQCLGVYGWGRAEKTDRQMKPPASRSQRRLQFIPHGFQLRAFELFGGQTTPFERLLNSEQKERTLIDFSWV
jgi:hypothetical protein